MNDPRLLNELLNQYNKIAYTHKYIIGFTENGHVYASFVTSEVLELICSLDKNGKGLPCMRYKKPSKKRKKILKSYTYIEVCSEDDLENEFHNTKYNRGQIFEKKITEKFEQRWQADQIPFTDAGDIEINKVPYQIKYQNASFCNVESIANLTRRYEERVCHLTKR